jgi:hypothetical protein
MKRIFVVVILCGLVLASVGCTTQTTQTTQSTSTNQTILRRFSDVPGHDEYVRQGERELRMNIVH